MSKIVIYQVLPRLFGNINPKCKPWGSKDENGVGKFSDFTPEILSGIKELSVTHIWYTGILEHATATDYSAYGITPDNKYVIKGLAGSPYAIKDYYDVDPDLATDVSSRKSEFCELIKRTHAAGMKVVIDFVPNHVARQYNSDSAPQGVLSLGSNDNELLSFSPQNNFYYLPDTEFAPSFYIGDGEEHYIEYPAKVTGNNCFSASPSVNDWYETIKLNYGVDYSNGNSSFDPMPDTWKKMLDILLYWASKGVDAFRCDMAEMIPVEFWQWSIYQVKRQYPDITFIAEVYNPSQYDDYIKRGGFDYLYDKVGLYDTLRAILSESLPAGAITRCWQSIESVKENMLHFTENHDEQRSASNPFGGDAMRAFPLFAVSALIDKNPIMLYFGQELGERGEESEGFSGLDGRTTIFDYWSIPSVRRLVTKGKRGLTAYEKKVRTQYEKLLAIATKQDGISNGDFFDLMYVNHKSPGFNPYSNYLFARRYKETLYIIGVNFWAGETVARINIPAHLFEHWKIKEGEYCCHELLTKQNKEVEISTSVMFDIRILPYGTTVWKCDRKKHKITSK
ncbi:MAG: alpha-amylase family protein [Bacteroidales bacterium]